MIIDELKITEQQKEIVRAVVKTASSICETSSNVEPMLMLVDLHGKQEMIGSSFSGSHKESERIKDHFADFAFRKSREMRAVFAVFVSESWTLSAEDADEYLRNIKHYQGIASHPRRKEIVAFSVETPFKMYSGMAPIIRTGKKRTMGSVDFIEPMQTQGRFSRFIHGR